MKRMFTYMFLTLVSVGTNALTAQDVFEAQTYSLFDRQHVTVKVMNGRIDLLDSKKMAFADLSIRINAERDSILNALGEKLQSDFVNYEFPVGALSKNETDQDRAMAETILSNGVAEFILHASLGSNIQKGLTIHRPNSKVEVLFDEDSQRNYLIIFGEKIYVD